VYLASINGPSADNATDRVFAVLSRIEQTTEYLDPT
jgi:hypothetical protein